VISVNLFSQVSDSRSQWSVCHLTNVEAFMQTCVCVFLWIESQTWHCTSGGLTVYTQRWLAIVYMPWDCFFSYQNEDIIGIVHLKMKKLSISPSSCFSFFFPCIWWSPLTSIVFFFLTMESSTDINFFLCVLSLVVCVCVSVLVEVSVMWNLFGSV